LKYFLELSAFLARKLTEEGESLETGIIVSMELYKRHVEKHFSWSTYSMLGKREKDTRVYCMNEFWLQFKSAQWNLLQSMRRPYLGIPDETLSPYLDGDREPNIHSPLHL